MNMIIYIVSFITFLVGGIFLIALGLLVTYGIFTSLAEEYKEYCNLKGQKWLIDRESHELFMAEQFVKQNESYFNYKDWGCDGVTYKLLGFARNTLFQLNQRVKELEESTNNSIISPFNLDQKQKEAMFLEIKNMRDLIRGKK